MEMKITQPIFGILVALTKKRTYQNDMKSTYVMKVFLFLRGQVLKPSEKVQTEMFCGGLAEILFRVADGNEAVFCLPGSDNCFEPSAHYGIDGVTEKVEI